jgi:hypothetical protein
MASQPRGVPQGEAAHEPVLLVRPSCHSVCACGSVCVERVVQAVHAADRRHTPDTISAPLAGVSIPTRAILVASSVISTGILTAGLRADLGRRFLGGYVGEGALHVLSSERCTFSQACVALRLFRRLIRTSSSSSAMTISSVRSTRPPSRGRARRSISAVSGMHNHGHRCKLIVQAASYMWKMIGVDTLSFPFGVGFDNDPARKL